MNERIKALIDQMNKSGLLYQAGDYEMTVTGSDLEYFAELIVRECMDVAKDHTPETEECEYTWLIHDKIKEHFGVAE